jgi:hypothetical protein
VTGPGFLLGRRYEENSGSPRFFGFSLTETREVLASVAPRARSTTDAASAASHGARIPQYDETRRSHSYW